MYSIALESPFFAARFIHFIPSLEKARRKAEAIEAAKRSADDMVSVGVEGTEEGKESDDVIQPQDQSLTSLVSETSLDLSAEVTLPETTTTVLENISEEGKEE